MGLLAALAQPHHILAFLGREESRQWVILGVGAFATLYILMRGRVKAKRDPLEHRPSLSVSQQRQIERDMSNLMVEMLETARQMTAQLDTRAARLEALIRDADVRLAQLKSPAPGAAAADQPGATAPEAAAEAPAPPAASEDVETPPDPRHAEIWALADEGQSPNEIARRLNRPNGEVELILAIRPQ